MGKSKTLFYQSESKGKPMQPLTNITAAAPPPAIPPLPWKTSSAKSASSSSVSASPPTGPPGCVCNRQVDAVVCPCGYYKQGLKSEKPCPIHPNVKYVKDLKKCPNCKGQQLEEASSDTP